MAHPRPVRLVQTGGHEEACAVGLGKGELDLHTLIWMGSAFQITSLGARLKCPRCGSRKVSVIFEVPSEPAAMQIAGMPSGAICRSCGKTRKLGPDELLGAADMDAFKGLEPENFVQSVRGYQAALHRRPIREDLDGRGIARQKGVWSPRSPTRSTWRLIPVCARAIS
jgi:hypothetical protein